MSWIDTFKSYMGFTPPTRKGANIVHTRFPTPSWTDNDYKSFVNNGYAGNELVHAALQLRMNSFVAAELVVENEEGERFNKDPRLEALYHPNNYMTHQDLMKWIVLQLDIDGNAFLLKELSVGRKVVGLHPLRPDRVVINPSSKPGELVKNYEYHLDGQKVVYKPTDIIHIKTPNPLSLLRGLSPLQACNKRVSTDNEARNFIKSLLENSGAPGGILKIMGDIAEGMSDRIASMWAKSTGGQNRGKMAVIPEDVEYIPVSLDLNEMDFSGITQMTETRILSVLGVNPVQLGVLSGQGGSTFNNVAEANLNFYLKTIIPLQKMVMDALTKDSDLNPNQAIRYRMDTTKVPDLAAKRMERFEVLQGGWDSGWVTMNEVRAEAGLPPMENGDELKQQSSPWDFPDDEDDMEIEEEAEEKDIEYVSKNLTALEDMQKALKLADEEREQKDLQSAESLRAIADEGYADLLDWSVKFYSGIYKTMEMLINESTKSLDDEQVDKLLRRLAQEQEFWKEAIVRDGNLPIVDIAVKSLKQTMSGELNIATSLADDEIREAIKSYTYKFADSISSTASKQIKNTLIKARESNLSTAELGQVLFEEFKGNVSLSRAKMIAQTETIRAANAGRLAGFKYGGVEYKEWLAAGDACPYCIGLNGETAEVSSPFVEGASYQPDEDTPPLDITYSNGFVDYPPIHPNCRCVIVSRSEG